MNKECQNCINMIQMSDSYHYFCDSGNWSGKPVENVSDYALKCVDFLSKDAEKWIGKLAINFDQNSESEPKIVNVKELKNNSLICDVLNSNNYRHANGLDLKEFDMLEYKHLMLLYEYKVSKIEKKIIDERIKILEEILTFKSKEIE